MTVKTVTDHAGRTVTYAFPPQRIISLCPSLTDTLYALGLGDRIVGRTQFCIHPADRVKDVRRVGGTKQIKQDVIAELAPTLIIAEKEENPKDMVEELAEQYPVYVSDVESYEDALRMIEDLGYVTGTESAAQAMVREIESAFAALRPVRSLRVAYFIWQNPYMVAGNHTYIHSLLTKCGLVNVFAEADGRYPSITEEQIRAANPDVIFLSSEPFPFQQTHEDTFRTLFPDCDIVRVDGEMFSWYGVHMKEAAAYLIELLTMLNTEGK